MDKKQAVEKKHSMSTVKAKNTIGEILMILFTCIFLFPFYVMIVLAVKTPSQALMNPLSFPTSFEFSNFINAWQMTDFPRTFANTFVITAASVILIVLVTGMGTFVMHRVKNRFIQSLYFFFIAGLMIPFYLSLSPSVKLMKNLGFMDSIPGICISYIGRNIPFAVFLFMGFIKSVPNDLAESAVIDGCNPFTMYWRIYFPLLKHVVSTLVILDTMSIWNDFLYPLLILQTKKHQTLTLVQYVFRSEASTQWNLIFASYLLSMLPLLITYFALQKNIVEGIAAGAVKG